jgi:hypothetical protein
MEWKMSLEQIFYVSQSVAAIAVVASIKRCAP